MEPIVGLNYSLENQSVSLSPCAPIWQDVLAQAMTGELVAAMNYTALSEICDDPEEVADARCHLQQLSYGDVRRGVCVGVIGQNRADVIVVREPVLLRQLHDCDAGHELVDGTEVELRVDAVGDVVFLTRQAVRSAEHRRAVVGQDDDARKSIL